MKKVALISGITGQDGSFLAEFLIDKGYEYTVFCAVLLRLTQGVLSIFILMSGCEI